jgi:hypothetical protein
MSLDEIVELIFTERYVVGESRFGPDREKHPAVTTVLKDMIREIAARAIELAAQASDAPDALDAVLADVCDHCAGIMVVNVGSLPGHHCSACNWLRLPR